MSKKEFNVGGCLPSPPDERDFACRSMPFFQMEIPETYLPKKYMKVLNQGSIGSCVAHACATAMGYGEMRAGLAPNDYSRGYIYGNRRPLDWQGEGMYIRQALKQLNHCGTCLYKDFPYNEMYPKVKERIEKDKEALAEKAAPYSIISYFRCYSEEEIKMTLINQGSIVMAIDVYDSFAGDCPLPQKDEKNHGGHALCIVGWDETGWIVQNSWSTIWGNKGFLHLPYEYPLNECWGLVVNERNEPKPKTNFFKRFFSWLKNLFKRLFKL